jgi:hypothetical protein
MNIILLGTYVFSILVLIIVISIIILKWKDYFPRKWIFLLTLSFIGLIIGLFTLIVAEMVAPYDSYFYLNPFLYITYFGLIGCSMFANYLIVVDIHFKHLKILLFLGILAFILLNFLLIISLFWLLVSELTRFPLISYIAFEIVYGLGIIAYILLAIGSFSSIPSDRLEQRIRYMLMLVGILSLGIAFGIVFMALDLLLFDFSNKLPTMISVFWLLWISFNSIIFLFMIRWAMSFIA